jgi:hypothetical protein
MLAAPYANAECRWHTEQDNVTRQLYEMIICTGSGAEVMLTCTQGLISFSVLPDAYIGGDATRVQVRGDLEDRHNVYAARVFNSGTGFVLDVNTALAAVETMAANNTVYFRYNDYRDVSMDVSISAAGFSALLERLACVQSAREIRDTPPVLSEETPGCANTCPTHDNGVCEDGANGSTADFCPIGTDCADCGARQTKIQ